jgi:hypothetical protein
MAADRYGIYSAEFVHAGGTLELTQLDQQSVNTGKSIRTIRPGGSITPAAHILSTANPRFRFRTTDILAFLTATSGQFHLACSGGHVAAYQLRLAGGAFASGSSHLLQTSAKGFLHCTSIDVDIDSTEGASMELEYVPLSTDGTAPYATAAGQSLSSQAAPAFSSQFYMGGVWKGASQVTGLTRASYRPGINFGMRRTDSGTFCIYNASSIYTITPAIDLTFLDLGLTGTVGSSFFAVVGAAIKGYLQRGTTAADGRIAAASSSHIKIACTDGSWGPENTEVSNEGDGTLTISVMPIGQLTATLSLALGA